MKATYFHLTDLASFIIKVAGLLIILASAVWWAPLIVLALAGLALTAGINGGKTIYRAEQEAAKHDRNTAYLGDVILGRDAAAERTLFGSSDFITGMWRQSFKQGLRIRFRARIKWYLNAYAGNITNLLIWLILMLLLLVPLQEGTVSIGLFLALTQAFTRFDIVWGFMDTVNGLAADAEFFKELSSFLSLPEENGGRNTISPAPEKRDGESSKTIPASAGSPARLELRNVRFRYPGTERWILDGLDMVLEPGKRYALVGANGCGKTTVTRLITGLYPVEAGTILLNGREISEYDPAELGYQFSIVYQDFARYGVSLHDNIFLGLDAIGDDTITPREIFAKAGLEALVDRLPMGADTPLGKFVPGGVDISGGEWQRVAMARTLARPSALRILDEPTAALDPVAESELYASFERLTEGTTTLLITHRLGATKTADVILVLDGGRIIETGSHKDLMRAEGLYSRMYESQRYWYEAN